MSDNLDGVKKTIKDLLNLANDDGAFDGEIENALKHAQRLMAEHHITEEDLKTSETKETFDEYETYSHGKSYTKWEARLCVFISKLVGSPLVYFHEQQLKRKGPVLRYRR